MSKFESLDSLVHENNGYLKTSEAVALGVSKPYISEYIRAHGLERVAHGLYMTQDAWDDGMYVIQTRYPAAVFSHETALYLHSLADREPTPYSITLKAGANAARLTSQGVKVYKVKEVLFHKGITQARSPAGHMLRVYNLERTICDLIRSRNNIETQELLSAIREYARSKEKNIPLLMRYAQAFSVEKLIRQYLEVLL